MAKRQTRSSHKSQSYDPDRYDFFPSSQPIKREDGIKAKNKRGAFGESWWGKRWLAVLEGYGMGSRLQRGRSYARGGQVLNLDIQAGQVTAQVQGSMPRPYRVKIQLPLLSDAEWAQVTQGMAAQAIFSAKLLSGEMPNEIETIFEAAHVSLFPKTKNQLQTQCSCPDVANPCKHIAAVYYLLAEQFDTDPFLIFTLRGRNQEQLTSALRALRSTIATPVAEAAPLPSDTVAYPLDAALDQFWAVGDDLHGFEPTIRSPAIDLAVLKRLGDSPFETRDGLAALYGRISTFALGMARGEHRNDPLS